MDPRHSSTDQSAYALTSWHSTKKTRHKLVFQCARHNVYGSMDHSPWSWFQVFEETLYSKTDRSKPPCKTQSLKHWLKKSASDVSFISFTDKKAFSSVATMKINSQNYLSRVRSTQLLTSEQQLAIRRLSWPAGMLWRAVAAVACTPRSILIN